MTKALRLATKHSKDRRDVTLVRGGLILSIALAVYMTGRVAAAQQSAKTPDDRVLANAVESYFASLPGYKKGDLITRSQIEKAIAKLEAAGVKVPDASAIAKLGLADDSFLVRELSTTQGKKFMRELAKDPSTFERLDRLSTIPRGQTLIRQLVREKGGDDLIVYLATTQGGKNMGSMMAQARGGVNLNKPTDRIYTVDDLVAELTKVLAKSAAPSP
jgi:hypothetical protein